jgi:hypothetical protein
MGKIAIAIPVERIERSIFLIRGQKVMLDADLADLYGVATKRLNEQVKRNPGGLRRISCFSSPSKKRPRWSQIATTSPG